MYDLIPPFLEIIGQIHVPKLFNVVDTIVKALSSNGLLMS